MPFPLAWLFLTAIMLSACEQGWQAEHWYHQRWESAEKK